MSARSLKFATSEPLHRRLFPNREWVLLVLLLVEVAIFGALGDNFLSRGNAFEIVRLSVEVGLLALALTPIIITGGIDLSVGSAMGLAAVTFGVLWRDHHFSLTASAVLAVSLTLAGGALNALLVARFKLPPLIVTLGTFSLFRGLAEGATGGAENYTDFPASFLHIGQGYLWGVLPAQSIALAAAAAFYYVLLHRAVIGRELYAVGYAPEGARHAGVPVARRLALVYVLAGAWAGVAAIIYVAHLGQAKSDAGTGYELMAITAVVLGGTSIFGGRGTVLGTVLGLFAIAVLQNGLRLAALPAELTGVLIGALLLVTVGVDRALSNPGAKRAASARSVEGDFEMKNSQVALICAAIMAAALIVAGSNWWLARSLTGGRAAGVSAADDGGENRGGTSSAAGRKITVGMMPKAKGDPYFISCRRGAEEAARELNVDLVWDGPTDLDPAKQNEVVEGWITRGVDVIAVSVENQAGISTVLRKARERGIPVVTWDADAQPGARDFFINQATPQGIGQTLTDEAARLTGGRGEFAVITASLSAANQNEWLKHIRARLAEKYPDLKLVAVQPSDGDRDRAFAETQTVLKVHPNVKLVMGIAAPAVPGAAEAVKQSGRAGEVKVIGLSLPNMTKPYVRDGVIESVVLWNTTDLGYLTVYAAERLKAGTLKRGASSIAAGRLGEIQIKEDQVMLGAPFVFNKGNIEQFDF